VVEIPRFEVLSCPLSWHWTQPWHGHFGVCSTRISCDDIWQKRVEYEVLSALSSISAWLFWQLSVCAVIWGAQPLCVLSLSLCKGMCLTEILSIRERRGAFCSLSSVEAFRARRTQKRNFGRAPKRRWEYNASAAATSESCWGWKRVENRDACFPHWQTPIYWICKNCRRAVNGRTRERHKKRGKNASETWPAQFCFVCTPCLFDCVRCPAARTDIDSLANVLLHYMKRLWWDRRGAKTGAHC
jgi:hypothetical protein